MSEEAIAPAALSKEEVNSTEVKSGTNTEDNIDENAAAVEGEKYPDVIEESKGTTGSGPDAAVEIEMEEPSENTEERKYSLVEEPAAETEEIEDKIGNNPELLENLETNGNIE